MEFPVIDIFQNRFCLLFISHDRPPKCHNWSFTWFTSFAQFQELIYSQLLKIHFGGLWLIYDDIFLFDLSIRPFVLLRNVFLNLCMWDRKIGKLKNVRTCNIVFSTLELFTHAKGLQLSEILNIPGIQIELNIFPSISSGRKSCRIKIVRFTCKLSLLPTMTHKKM